MKLIRVVLVAACMIGFIPSSVAVAQGPENKSPSVTALMRQMTGTWQVRSRMWPGPDAKAVDLPPAIVHRELIQDAFLQEVMEPSNKSETLFTRISYFSYNAINQQYEYFSLDTRLPQMMNYTVPGANKIRNGKVELAGTSFVAPEWGTKKKRAIYVPLGH